jgi:hypothetical protein
MGIGILSRFAMERWTTSAYITAHFLPKKSKHCINWDYKARTFSMPLAFTPLQKFLLVATIAITLCLCALFLGRVSGDTQIALTLSAQSSLEEGLVGHWTFDGANLDLTQVTAEVRDSSGNNRNGNWQEHASTTANGPLGQALSFDGIDDGVSFADQAAYSPATNDITVGVWARVPTNAPPVGDGECNGGEGGYFFTKASDGGWEWEFENESNSRLCFRLAREFGPTHALVDDFRTVNDGQWHHYAATVDDLNQVNLYVDGDLASSTTSFSGSMVNDSASLWLGRHGNAHVYGNRYFTGDLDDARIYSRTLSAEEVRRLYKLGATSKLGVTPPSPETTTLGSGLVGHWTFDGRDLYPNIRDRSADANHGTLILGASSTATTTGEGRIGQALSFDYAGNVGLNAHKNGDYIDVPYDASLELGNEGGALAAWFKVSNQIGQNTAHSLIYKRNHSNEASIDGLYLNVHRGALGVPMFLRGTIAFNGPIDNLKPTTAGLEITPDTWYHGLMTYDASNIYLYLNGEKIGEMARTATIAYDMQLGVYIGRSNLAVGHSGDLDGLLDDVRIYNRTLSADEVMRLYKLGATTKISTTQTPPKLETGLVGHWTFDGPHLLQNVADASGQGNHARRFSIPQTATSTIEGVIGQALLINVDDHVVGPDIDTLDDPDEFTVSVWVYHTDLESDDAIFDKSTGGSNNGIFLFRNDQGDTGRDDNYTIFVADGSDTDNARIESVANASLLSKWTHVAATYVRNSATGLRLYINGVEDPNSPVSTTAIQTIESSTAQALIGENNAGGRDYVGAIDDVRVYTHALSADEIAELYNMGS